MTKTTKRARDLAARTTDAYSSGRYRSWARVAHLLLREGYTDRQVEAIMRSKWTRWASDQYHGKAPAHAVLDLMKRWPQEYDYRAVIGLEKATFND